MFNYVLQKIKSTGPRKSLALGIPVIMVFGACLLLIVMSKNDADVTPEPQKNKLETLVTEIAYYIWKPKPVEGPKYNCLQRLWHYLK